MAAFFGGGSTLDRVCRDREDVVVSERPIRALVVDDHVAYRRSAVTLLRSIERFDQIDEAVSGEEALEALARSTYALVLMDVQMRGIGGVGAAAIIRDQYPATAVILMSATDRPDLPREARSLGASFVPKSMLGPDEVELAWDALRRPDSSTDG